MVPVLIFFGIATVIAGVLWGILGLRLRAAARRPDVSDDDLCQLRQANRVSSFLVRVSLVGLGLIASASVVLWATSS